MGVNLTPIMVKKTIRLKDLRGKSLAMDANNMLYQFLSLIRAPDGTPLKDRWKRHLSLSWAPVSLHPPHPRL